MTIGLVDVEFENSRGRKKFPNLALCRIAAYHKMRGDEVEWALPLKHYNKVYISKVFNFTPNPKTGYMADEIHLGGTGYDIKKKLPPEIDECKPDFTIYPFDDGKTAYGFLTRGCIRKCPWCVVPMKEGDLKVVSDIDEVAQGRKNVVLMDNNFLASGDFAKEQLRKIAGKGYHIDFNQSLDCRLVTDEFASLLVNCKWINGIIRFSADFQGEIKPCLEAVEKIEKAGFTGQFIIDCLLQNDIEECLNRIDTFVSRTFRARKDGSLGMRPTIPCAMPFRDVNDPTMKLPQWQRDMARWCNQRESLMSTRFEDFSPRKGFVCGEYLKTKKENDK